MITFKGSSKKTRKVAMKPANAIDDFNNGIREGLYDAGREHVIYLRRKITTGSRSGRIYSFRGGQHQASAPGEFPANRTGNLAKSSDYVTRGHTELEVGESAEYARYLEDGTSRMDPRPHLEPTALAKRRDTQQILCKSVLRKVSKI